MTSLIRFAARLLLLAVLIVLAKAILWGVLYSFEYIGISIFSGEAAGWINWILYAGLGYGLGQLFSKYRKGIFYAGYALLFIFVSATFHLDDVVDYFLWINDFQSNKGIAWDETIRITNEILTQKTNHSGLLGYVLVKDVWSNLDFWMYFCLSAIIAYACYVGSYEDSSPFGGGKLAAAQGDAVAQNSLGVRYADGQGVKQDYAKAIKLFKLAAAQGVVDAQSNLGAMYSKGRGVTQDEAEAVKWFKLAAAQGDAVAQSNLGAMYSKGRGVIQDEAEAVKWYKLAAVQGHAVSQFNLGVMYADGRGVIQDDAEAVKWYKLAAAQGDVDAQANLATMYHQGKGVIQDDVLAHMWWNLAAAQGHADAKTNNDMITKKLTAEQLATAEKLACECQAKNYKNC